MPISSIHVSLFFLGFNLLLCAYAMGDKEKMKKAFQKLSQLSTGVDDEEKYTAATVRMFFIRMLRLYYIFLILLMLCFS